MYPNVPAELTDQMAACVRQVQSHGYDEQAAIAIGYRHVVEGVELNRAMSEHRTAEGFTAQRGTLAADLSAADDSGHVWEVTIIGPATPADLVTIDGEQYIKSKNGRFYSARALEQAAPLFDGAKSYDDHLTDTEFTERAGMRPPNTDWLASIVQPRWDRATHSLRGVYKVVDDKFASKLRRANQLGVLHTIGLSLDIFEDGITRAINGVKSQLITVIKQVNSVDAVGNPAAGGQFIRLLESKQMEGNMEELIKQLEQLAAAVNASSLSEEQKGALVAEIEKIKASMTEGQGEGATESVPPAVDMQRKVEAIAANVKRALETVSVNDTLAEAKRVLAQAQAESARIIEAGRVAESARTLESKLQASGLTDKARGVIRKQFAGRVFEAGKLDEAIEDQRAIALEFDQAAGAVNAHYRPRIAVGRTTEADRFALDLMRLMMGNTRFSGFDLGAKDRSGREIFASHRDAGYTRAIENWIADGKPALPRSTRLSEWYYQLTGGGVAGDGDYLGVGQFSRRATEANLTTTTLSSIVKNAVNILLAADYSVRYQWWDSLVENEDVDTIDQATLVRLFGISTFPTVPEGGAYTELALSDEEETATFYKKGGYVGITIETFLRDKLGKLATIPTRLANAWYNTVGASVAAVFTTASGSGPTLSDTGTLFNATAVGTAGGHANLGTTALSHAAVVAARAAMMKQTDQPLGAGARLGMENQPTHLLVPIDLEVTGNEIRNSEFVPGSANLTQNQLYQKFEVVPVPNFTDVTDWAMLGKPGGRSPINLIWLRGRRTPELFTADTEENGAMFTNDELRFKVRKFNAEITDGVAPIADFRGVYKANVAG